MVYDDSGYSLFVGSLVTGYCYLDGELDINVEEVAV